MPLMIQQRDFISDEKEEVKATNYIRIDLSNPPALESKRDDGAWRRYRSDQNYQHRLNLLLPFLKFAKKHKLWVQLHGSLIPDIIRGCYVRRPDMDIEPDIDLIVFLQPEQVPLIRKFWAEDYQHPALGTLPLQAGAVQDAPDIKDCLIQEVWFPEQTMPGFKLDVLYPTTEQAYRYCAEGENSCNRQLSFARRYQDGSAVFDITTSVIPEDDFEDIKLGRVRPVGNPSLSKWLRTLKNPLKGLKTETSDQLNYVYQLIKENPQGMMMGNLPTSYWRAHLGSFLMNYPWVARVLAEQHFFYLISPTVHHFCTERKPLLWVQRQLEAAKKEAQKIPNQTHRRTFMLQQFAEITAVVYSYERELAQNKMVVGTVHGFEVSQKFREEVINRLVELNIVVKEQFAQTSWEMLWKNYREFQQARCDEEFYYKNKNAVLLMDALYWLCFENRVINNPSGGDVIRAFLYMFVHLTPEHKSRAFEKLSHITMPVNQSLIKNIFKLLAKSGFLREMKKDLFTFFKIFGDLKYTAVKEKSEVFQALVDTLTVEDFVNWSEEWDRGDFHNLQLTDLLLQKLKDLVSKNSPCEPKVIARFFELFIQNKVPMVFVILLLKPEHASYLLKEVHKAVPSLLRKKDMRGYTLFYYAAFLHNKEMFFELQKLGCSLFANYDNCHIPIEAWQDKEFLRKVIRIVDANEVRRLLHLGIHRKLENLLVEILDSDKLATLLRLQEIEDLVKCITKDKMVSLLNYFEKNLGVKQLRPVFLGAVGRGDSEFIKAWIKQQWQLDVNWRSNTGKSALYIAATRGHNEIACLLTAPTLRGKYSNFAAEVRLILSLLPKESELLAHFSVLSSDVASPSAPITLATVHHVVALVEGKRKPVYSFRAPPPILPSSHASIVSTLPSRSESPTSSIAPYSPKTADSHTPVSESPKSDVILPEKSIPVVALMPEAEEKPKPELELKPEAKPQSIPSWPAQLPVQNSRPVSWAGKIKLANESHEKTDNKKLVVKPVLVAETSQPKVSATSEVASRIEETANAPENKADADGFQIVAKKKSFRPPAELATPISRPTQAFTPIDVSTSLAAGVLAEEEKEEVVKKKKNKKKKKKEKGENEFAEFQVSSQATAQSSAQSTAALASAYLSQLQNAIEKGLLDQVRVLVKEQGADIIVNQTFGEQQDTTMHLAARCKQPEILNYLLQKNPLLVNKPNKRGVLPLEEVIKNRDEKCFDQILWTEGFDPTLKSKNKSYVVHVAENVKGELMNTWIALLVEFSKKKLWQEVFKLIAKDEPVGLSKLLQRSKNELGCNLLEIHVDSELLLPYAAYKGSLKCITEIFDAEPKFINKTDMKGRNLVEIARLANQPEVERFLITKSKVLKRWVADHPKSEFFAKPPEASNSDLMKELEGFTFSV